MFILVGILIAISAIAHGDPNLPDRLLNNACPTGSNCVDFKECRGHVTFSYQAVELHDDEIFSCGRDPRRRNDVCCDDRLFSQNKADADDGKSEGAATAATADGAGDNSGERDDVRDKRDERQQQQGPHKIRDERQEQQSLQGPYQPHAIENGPGDQHQMQHLPMGREEGHEMARSPIPSYGGYLGGGYGGYDPSGYSGVGASSSLGGFGNPYSSGGSQGGYGGLSLRGGGSGGQGGSYSLGSSSSGGSSSGLSSLGSSLGASASSSSLSALGNPFGSAVSSGGYTGGLTGSSSLGGLGLSSSPLTSPYGGGDTLIEGTKPLPDQDASVSSETGDDVGRASPEDVVPHESSEENRIDPEKLRSDLEIDAMRKSAVISNLVPGRRRTPPSSDSSDSREVSLPDVELIVAGESSQSPAAKSEKIQRRREEEEVYGRNREDDQERSKKRRRRRKKGSKRRTEEQHIFPVMDEHPLLKEIRAVAAIREKLAVETVVESQKRLMGYLTDQAKRTQASTASRALMGIPSEPNDQQVNPHLGVQGLEKEKVINLYKIQEQQKQQGALISTSSSSSALEREKLTKSDQHHSKQTKQQQNLQKEQYQVSGAYKQEGSRKSSQKQRQEEEREDDYDSEEEDERYQEYNSQDGSSSSSYKGGSGSYKGGSSSYKGGNGSLKGGSSGSYKKGGGSYKGAGSGSYEEENKYHKGGTGSYKGAGSGSYEKGNKYHKGGTGSYKGGQESYEEANKGGAGYYNAGAGSYEERKKYHKGGSVSYKGGSGSYEGGNNPYKSGSYAMYENGGDDFEYYGDSSDGDYNMEGAQYGNQTVKYQSSSGYSLGHYNKYKEHSSSRNKCNISKGRKKGTSSKLSPACKKYKAMMKYRKTCGLQHPVMGPKQYEYGQQPEGTVEQGEWPFVVAVMSKSRSYSDRVNYYEYLCAGTLLSAATYGSHILQIVVTAAHCLHGLQARDIIVRGGTTNIDPNVRELKKHVDRKIRRIVVHPEYDPNELLHDIALLVLEKPLPAYISHVGPACLKGGNAGIDETDCVAVGWGSFGKKDTRSQLREVPVNLETDTNRCTNKMARSGYFRRNQPRIIRRRQLCHEVRPTPKPYPGNTCRGDGGGGIYCRRKQGSNGQKQWVLRAIISYGVDCNRRNVPGVDIDVQGYTNWILDNYY